MIHNFLETGMITGTHGLKGEMRMQPWGDSPAQVASYKKLYLDSEGGTKLEIEKMRVQGTMIILKVKGVESIDDAEKYRGRKIYVSRKDVPLEEGSHFVADIIGCEVYDADSGECYGSVTDVTKTGANDVWHIGDKMVPVIDDVVLETDVKNNRIVIRPLKGLFSDED